MSESERKFRIEKECRLLRFSEKTNSEALDEFESNIPITEEDKIGAHLKDKLSKDEQAALGAIDDSKLKWNQVLNPTREGRGKARLVNSVTTEAKRRLEVANTHLESSSNDALKKLSKRASRSFRSASLISYEKDVLLDARKGLDERRTFLLAASQKYREAAATLGLDVKTGTVDPPQVKSLDIEIKRMDSIIAARKKTETDSPENKALERVREVDKLLREFLMNADPNLFIDNLNDWIIEAASGDPRKLNNAINEIKFADDTRKGRLYKTGKKSEQRRVLLALVKEITGGNSILNRRKVYLRRQAIASFYTQQTTKNAEEVSSTEIKIRLHAVTELPVGSTVILNNTTFGIAKHREGTGEIDPSEETTKRIFLLSKKGPYRAVIDIGRGKMTVRTEGDTSERDRHYNLKISTGPVVIDGVTLGPDPSRVLLNAVAA